VYIYLLFFVVPNEDTQLYWLFYAFAKNTYENVRPQMQVYNGRFEVFFI